MQTSARTSGRSAADSVIQNVIESQVVKSVYFNHPSQGNLTNYYIIPGPHSTNKQIPSEVSEVPSDTVIHFFPILIHRRALLSANQRQGLLNRLNIPRTCWAQLFGPQMYLCRCLTNTPNYIREAKVHPTIVTKCSQLCLRKNVRPIKNRL